MKSDPRCRGCSRGTHGPRCARDRAFTLVETLLCLLLATLLLGVLLSSLLFLQRSLVPQRVLVEGAALPIAPSYAAFPAAIAVQERLLAHLDGSLATYVFGGGHAGLSSVPAGIVTKPLSAGTLPRISGLHSGLPQDSASFLRLYSSELGGVRSDARAADFTVLVIGTREGVPTVTCLVQCASSEVQASGDQRVWRKFEVELRDVEGSSLGYAFLERPGTEASPCSGAVHTWHRLNEMLGIFEEGPACVVMPDPWRFGGDPELSAEGKAFSRFTFFLPIGA